MMRTLIAAATAAVAATFAVAAPAQASCFYNQSEIAYTGVKLDCGWFCSNTWSIRKGDHNCRGGTGGNFTVNALRGDGGHYISGWVEDRGYVTIHGSCKTGMTVKVWKADHSLLQELTFSKGLAECE